MRRSFTPEDGTISIDSRKHVNSPVECNYFGGKFDESEFLRSKIEEQNKVIATLESELQTLKDKISSLKEDNKKLKQRVSASKEGQKEKLNQSLQTRNQEIITLRKSNLDYQTEIQEKSHNISFLEDNIQQINANFSLKESELSHKITELTEELYNAKSSLQTAMMDNSKFNSILSTSLKNRNLLEEKVIFLRTSYATLGRMKYNTDLSVVEMKEYMNSVSIEKEGLLKKTRVLTKQVSFLRRENNFLITQIVSLDRQLHELAEIQIQNPTSSQSLNNFQQLDVNNKALDYVLHQQTLTWSLQEDISGMSYN